MAAALPSGGRDARRPGPVRAGVGRLDDRTGAGPPGRWPVGAADAGRPPAGRGGGGRAQRLPRRPLRAAAGHARRDADDRVRRRLPGSCGRGSGGRGYYQETKRQTPLFGIPDRLLPISYQDFLDYVRKMVEGPDLTISEDARSLAAAVLHPPVPAVLRPAAAAARVIAVGMLPAPLQERFGLRWGPAERAEFVSSSAAVRTARRLMPRSAREWPHAAVAARRVRG